MSMKKRLISVILVSALLASLLSVSSFAIQRFTKTYSTGETHNISFYLYIDNADPGSTGYTNPSVHAEAHLYNTNVYKYGVVAASLTGITADGSNSYITIDRDAKYNQFSNKSFSEDKYRCYYNVGSVYSHYSYTNLIPLYCYIGYVAGVKGNSYSSTYNCSYLEIQSNGLPYMNYFSDAISKWQEKTWQP